MRVGVLGTGPVGQALATGLVELGHEVKMGSRTPDSESVRTWISQHKSNTSSGSVAEAADFGEIVVLATKWDGVESTLTQASGKLDGKVLIDVTNPLAMSPVGPALAVAGNDSGGEQVQRWAPKAKVVKTLNIINNAYMVNPYFSEGEPTMYVCGNYADAKEIVTEILKAFGWKDILDIGGIEGARELEALCILWVKSATAVGSWDIGFKLLRKEAKNE